MSILATFRQISECEAMTFEDVDVDAVADLGPEDVEAREVFGEDKVGMILTSDWLSEHNTDL